VASMKWTCMRCGLSATVKRSRLLLTMGWLVTGDRVCLCARCAEGRRLDEITRVARAMRQRAVRMRAESEQMVRAAHAQRARCGNG
jgi:hypothetical protein